MVKKSLKGRSHYTNGAVRRRTAIRSDRTRFDVTAEIELCSIYAAFFAVRRHGAAWFRSSPI